MVVQKAGFYNTPLCVRLALAITRSTGAVAGREVSISQRERNEG